MGNGASEPAPRFAAFISYARGDEAFARMLETALESFRPGDGRPTAAIFRDRVDFTGTEYYRALEEHLRDSAKLIVVCSPSARQSDYVGDEIRRFAKIRGTEAIVPVLLSGLPNQEADHRKAFPDALIEVMGGNPLGVEYRGFAPDRDRVAAGGRFEAEWYKLLANVHGGSAADMRERDRQHQVRALRRRLLLSSVGVLVLAAAFAGAITLWQRARAAEREALRQTERAEIAERLANEMSARSQTELAEAKRPAEPPPAAPVATRRVYFHIRDEQQRAGAARVQAALERQGIVVPGIQRLDVGPTQASELRYFREGEAAEAAGIVTALRELGVANVVTRKVDGYDAKVPRHQFELWLSAGALGGRASSGG